MSSMRTHYEAGAINVLLIPLILVILLLIGAAGFGFWAFGQRQDYKNNVQEKIDEAVADAKRQVSTQKDKEYAEKEKYPFDIYQGPAAYGSVVVKYPRTWSGYVATSTGANPIDGYFHPKQVPTITDNDNTFALRVRVVQQSYSAILTQFQSYIKQGKTAAHPYKSPNVPDVVGMRLDGYIGPKKQGGMVVMPYRDKSLEIWTESSAFVADFNNIILPNFTLSP